VAFAADDAFFGASCFGDSCFGGACFGGSCFGGSCFVDCGSFCCGEERGCVDDGRSCWGLLSAFEGSGSDAVGWPLDAGALGSEPASCFSPPCGAPPSSIFSRSCPTVTVSSSFTKNSLTVPASGALTATSIWERSWYQLGDFDWLCPIIPYLSQWLQAPHPVRQSSQFLEEGISHREGPNMPACYGKTPEGPLRFDHCFRVPSDIDSAIGGTLTILSAGRLLVFRAIYWHLSRVDTVRALLHEAHPYSSGTRPFVPMYVSNLRRSVYLQQS